MKIKEIEYSVTSYDRTLEIEKDGESYFVTIHWDNQNGYECNWFGSDRRYLPEPKWATEIEENSEDSLGWNLELLADSNYWQKGRASENI